MTSLVIGWGNTLRRDDGVGVLIAEEVESCGRDDVRTIAVPQLTPELAADIAAADRVIFVDAGATGEEVELIPLAAGRDGLHITHHATPDGLLTLAATLYEANPEAWLFTIPAHDLHHGEGLSEATRVAAWEAVDAIEDLLP